MNLNLHQRGHNQLADELLKTYIKAIKFYEDEPDFTTMDKLHTIKNLINRKAFSLSEDQIYFIHCSFKDFYHTRRLWLETHVKTGGPPTLHPVAQPYKQRLREDCEQCEDLNDSTLDKHRVFPSKLPKNTFDGGSKLEQNQYNYKPVKRGGSRMSNSNSRQQEYSGQFDENPH